MKLAEWVWSRTRRPADNALRLLFMLVGLPFCLVVLIMIARSATSDRISPVPTVERWIEPLSDASFDTLGFARLAPQRPDLSAARWSEITLPDTMALAPITDSAADAPMARLWLRVRYQPPPALAPSSRLAIHVNRIMGGAWSVWANDGLVDANTDNWRMQWNTPLFVKLPLGIGRNGEPVIIDIAVPYRLSQGYAVGSVYVGPADAVERHHDRRLLWQAWLPRAGLLVTLLLGLLALQFWLGMRTDSIYLMLALTCLVWFVANAQYFVDFQDETTSRWFGALDDAAMSWLPTMFFLFAMRFGKRRWPFLELLMVLYAAAVAAMTIPVWQWDVTGLVLQHIIDLVISFGTLGLLAWVALRDGGHELRVITAAVWCIPILGVYDVYFMTSQRLPDSIHLFPYATFVVFGAFLYAMQRRHIAAQAALEELNVTLDHRLRAREAQLVAQHDQLLAIERDRALHEERQRIMRDMHDGIGTSLMTSLAAAQQGRLTSDRASIVLRECLDELKLVVDSLEPVEHDVAALLGNLRYRFGRRVEESGLRIQWHVGELPPVPWLDPASALQVLRIVQEAATNVLKHARARLLIVEARGPAATAVEPAILVRIIDDGVGFNASKVTHGRGLDNLRHRAELIGCALHVHSNPGRGTTVELQMPLRNLRVPGT